MPKKTKEEDIVDDVPVVDEEKKKKKKKKAQREEVEAEAAAPVASEEVDGGKKKKKKDKKREREGEEASLEVVEEVEEPKKKKNKKKKNKEDASEETVEEVKEHSKKKKGKEGERNGASLNGNHQSSTSSGDGGIRFNFYQEKSTASEADILKWRNDKFVTLDGGEFKPLRSFDEAKRCFPADVIAVTQKFKEPSAIQGQAWPICLAGRDLVGISETGSGKTLAFALPSVVHFKAQEGVGSKLAKRGPIVLVLAPTRELAMQIQATYEDISKHCPLVSACIYGGVSKSDQAAAVRNGVHVVVATPGRLMNLMDEGVLSLNRVTYLILDEADRMLDMGFEPDIRFIVSNLTSPRRQTLMFSATWPKDIQKLAAEFLNNPARVTIGSPDLAANHRVTQTVEVVEPFDKDRRLLALLNKYHRGNNRILVFVLYKKEAPRVERNLTQRGFNVLSVHGDHTQEMRQKAVADFKSGKVPILIATDVCARGLDIPDVEYVINYSFPLTVEDYVHRIGRTGRAGKAGEAYTFFTVADKLLAGPLCDVLREADQVVPESLTAFGYAPTKKKDHALYGAHFKADKDLPMQKATKIVFD